MAEVTIKTLKNGPLSVEGALTLEDVEEEPDDLEIHEGRHEPGSEFDSTSGRNDAEADSTDEIDTASNQSLVPSSFGMTFCVDGTVDHIVVGVRWGRYERIYEHDKFKTKRNKETN